MNTRVGFLLACLIAALAVTAEAQPPVTYPDRALVVQLTDVQTALYNERFAEADSISRVMIDQRPDDPVGYLFRAAAMLSEMTAFEENLYGDLFTDLIDTSLALAAKRSEQSTGARRAWMQLYRGHAHAYRALWESRFGSFVSAVRNGFAARNEYEDGLKADSSVYDLYLGLGSYHYWKSARAGMLRWLGVLSNDKERGLRELRLAADSSLVFRDAARQAMIWIMLDRGDYDSVVVVASEAAEKYPDGNLFLWPLAQAQYELREYRDAIDTYRTIRARLDLEDGNYFNRIEADYRLTQCYEKVSELDRARTIARGVNDYVDHVPKRIRQLHRRALDYLQQLART
ncbi:hypothetical protein KQH82_12515 [bacterium]|nr:hypothetical protein [bacterium]